MLPNVSSGKPYPLGATPDSEGTNFSLFGASASSVDLLLFDGLEPAQPSRVIHLNPEDHRTYYYWHVWVPDVGDGQLYGYRVDGPYEPERGMRFNPSKVLLDPYARAVAYDERRSRNDAFGFGDNVATAPRSVVVDVTGYDWEGDEHPRRPMRDTVIYELHVRGLTAHPSSGVDAPGTFQGLVSKIPYLKDLGVTAVELMPVQQFDEQDVARSNPLTGERLTNYWGYSPLAFFSPHLSYVSARDARHGVDEFRDMVKALHRAGIEVILDVVFNHTAESDHTGPTLSFRGLENSAYYILQQDPRYYLDVTGTGNTVSCNHSVVRRLIGDCLRYWVREYHVDGFRFDLASVLSRDEQGEPLRGAPILWEIESDPFLASTKLIAEAWDAAGLYQLGDFTGDRWAEWNGRFRDDLRRFARGDDGTVRDLAWRMTGSFDVFRGKASYVSHRSINFVTCHDGFTLRDLVSYEEKHNEANGEENRDGTDLNLSWNCGVEGPAEDPHVLAMRRRYAKGLLTLLLCARGTPMLLGGDEFWRTQGGNNNAYCQDNEMSWFDWRLIDDHAGLHRFVREVIALRRRYGVLTADRTLGFRPPECSLHDDVTFHGVRLHQPDWGHTSHSLAMHFHAPPGEPSAFLIANAYCNPLAFELPAEIPWRRLVDTSLSSGQDILPTEEAPLLQQSSYEVTEHSVVVLGEDVTL